MSIRLLFESRDCWIGVFWSKSGTRVTTLEKDYNLLHIYLCIIPCVPILFTIRINIPPEKRHLNW